MIIVIFFHDLLSLVIVFNVKRYKPLNRVKVTVMRGVLLLFLWFYAFLIFFSFLWFFYFHVIINFFSQFSVNCYNCFLYLFYIIAKFMSFWCFSHSQLQFLFLPVKNCSVSEVNSWIFFYSISLNDWNLSNHWIRWY